MADLTKIGTEGSDVFVGGAGNDTLYGQGGDDYLLGGSGNDFLSGGDGNDHLYGGIGNDYLSGGRGDDTLAGGEGADTFRFVAGGGHDTITDFRPLEGDRLDLANTSHDFTNWVDVANHGYNFDGGSVLDLGGGDTVTLMGVSIDQVLDSINY